MIVGEGDDLATTAGGNETLIVKDRQAAGNETWNESDEDEATNATVYNEANKTSNETDENEMEKYELDEKENGAE